MTIWFDDKSKKYVGRNEGEYLVKYVNSIKTQLDDAMDAHRNASELDHPEQSVKSQHIADSAVTTSKITNNAITAEKIGANAVENRNLANNAVTHYKIADANITTSKIADGAVTTAKIGSNAVENRNLANNAVTHYKIADTNITTSKIANGAVTAAKLTNNAVITEKIANGAVTDAKLDQTTQTRLSLIHYNSPEDPTNITLSRYNLPNPDNITGINNTGVGASFSNLTTGGANVALGNASLRDITTGSNNAAVGYNTLRASTSANSNTVIGSSGGVDITSGSDNVGVGKGVLSGIQSGIKNTAIGTNALSAASGANPQHNTVIGYNAGKNISGSGNVFIGFNVGVNSTASNTLQIGAGTNGDVLVEGNATDKTVMIRNVLQTKPIITPPANADEGAICTNFFGRPLLKRNGAWEKIYTVPTQEPINTPYDTGRWWINGAPIYRINMFYRVSGQDLIDCGGDIFKGNFADMVDDPQQASGIDLTTETINSLLRITDGAYAEGGLLPLTDMNSVQLNEDASYYSIPQSYTIDSQHDYYIFGYIEYLCDLTGDSSSQIDISEAKELNIQ